MCIICLNGIAPHIIIWIVQVYIIFINSVKLMAAAIHLFVFPRRPTDISHTRHWYLNTLRASCAISWLCSIEFAFAEFVSCQNVLSFIKMGAAYVGGRGSWSNVNYLHNIYFIIRMAKDSFYIQNIYNKSNFINLLYIHELRYYYSNTFPLLLQSQRQ